MVITMTVYIVGMRAFEAWSGPKFPGVSQPHPSYWLSPSTVPGSL